MSSNRQQLPDVFLTVQDVSHCIRELAEHKNRLYSRAVALRVGVVADTSEPAVLSDAAQTILSGTRQPTVADVEAAITYLEKALTETTIVKIVAAAPLSAGGQRRIVRWFRSLTGQMVLCNFATDNMIAGGVVVYTPKRVFDYSYTTQVTAQLSVLQKELLHG